MAPPTAAASPGTPTGKMLPDGHKTLVGLSLGASIALWEKTVTPPGLDGGDMVDITTMHNNTVRTMWPRALVTVTDMTFTSGFDPAVYATLITMINDPQTITVFFPNGGKLAYYGVIRTVEAGEQAEGTHPEFTVTVSSTNTDPATGTEELPVYTLPP